MAAAPNGEGSPRSRPADSSSSMDLTAQIAAISKTLNGTVLREQKLFVHPSKPTQKLYEENSFSQVYKQMAALRSNWVEEDEDASLTYRGVQLFSDHVRSNMPLKECEDL